MGVSDRIASIKGFTSSLQKKMRTKSASAADRTLAASQIVPTWQAALPQFATYECVGGDFASRSSVPRRRRRRRRPRASSGEKICGSANIMRAVSNNRSPFNRRSGAVKQHALQRRNVVILSPRRHWQGRFSTQPKQRFQASYAFANTSSPEIPEIAPEQRCCDQVSLIAFCRI
ncbi:hypothetical protein FI667_g12605, partial [Globisporangium splendens]